MGLAEEFDEEEGPLEEHIQRLIDSEKQVEVLKAALKAEKKKSASGDFCQIEKCNRHVDLWCHACQTALCHRCSRKMVCDAAEKHSLEEFEDILADVKGKFVKWRYEQEEKHVVLEFRRSCYTQLSSTTTKKYLTYVGTLDERLQTLLNEVEYEGDGKIHHISISHNKLAIIDYVNKELRICTPDGAHMYNIKLKDMIGPYGVELLPADNSVLVTDLLGDQLRKYRLEPDAEPVWTCSGLTGPTGATTDESGLIYVTTWYTGFIYLISPHGEKIKELNHPMLKDSIDKKNYIDDISVSDGRMVVACRDEGVMYFNLV